MAKDSNHPLAHVLALNNDPGLGMKANRVPAPGKPNIQAFAKGGKVQGKLVQFYAKGGAVKCAKGGKVGSGKKVMGTVGEAKSIMKALKSVKAPASPPPGLAAASPMMPQAGAGMPPPMKKGGKVRKKMAAGGAAKARLAPKPKPIKKVDYTRGG